MTATEILKQCKVRPLDLKTSKLGQPLTTEELLHLVRWQHELRYGGYRQVQGIYADTGGGMCGLGVGLKLENNLNQRVGVRSCYQEDGIIKEVEGLSYTPGSNTLTLSISKKLGVLVADLNDFQNYTFSQIADALDEAYERLFPGEPSLKERMLEVQA